MYVTQKSLIFKKLGVPNQYFNKTKHLQDLLREKAKRYGQTGTHKAPGRSCSISKRKDYFKNYFHEIFVIDQREQKEQTDFSSS